MECLMQRIKGHEKAVKVYLEVYKQISTKYLDGYSSEKYLAYLQVQAGVFKAKELAYLKAFGRNDAGVKKIMSEYD